MLNYIHRLLFKSQRRSEIKEMNESEKVCKKITSNIDDNLEFFKNQHGESSDIIVREFRLGMQENLRGAVIYVDGLIKTEVLNEFILKPLMLECRKTNAENITDINQIKENLITVGEISVSGFFGKLTSGYMSGDVVLLIENQNLGLIISCKGWDKRSVTEPETEAVVRGPREGFTENIRTNTALLRRKIKDPKLYIENMIIGEKTHTPIAVAYIDGVANPELIKTIKERLSAIRIDSVLESGYIEEYIEDSPYSIFATIASSEKPDIVAAKVLEGRAAILVDGTPFVLTAPMLMAESFQSPEDYYIRSFYATFIRILRYFSFALSMLAPAIYVALTTFHQELLPTVLLFTMSSSREGIPFPAVFEALIMIVTFEILREAGLRLPRPVGQAVSIVGALVVGEAAVSAGIIGAPMVIVVAITAVAGFVVPTQTDVVTIMRFILLLLAGFLGGIGIMLGLLCMVIHLAGLKSFGVSYLAPFAPLQKDGLKDSIVRMPLWTMLSRPKSIAKGDITRRDFFIPPGVPSQNDDADIDEGD